MKKNLLLLVFVIAAALCFSTASAADDSLIGTATVTLDPSAADFPAWDPTLEDWSAALYPSTTQQSTTQQCIGTLPAGTYQDVTVPPGGACFIDSSDTILHDLTVLTGARLRDSGAYIGHDVRAKAPASMEVGGVSLGNPGTVGHDIHIAGTTGIATSGTNYVCNQQVGHDVVVVNSGSTASPWLIGDNGPGDFNGCGNAIAHDLVVQNNANHVDVDTNNPAAPGAIGAGIGHDLHVANNSGGTLVNFNTAGHDCAQKNNSPYSGTGNVADNNNNCNTTYP
jgi:hypothetical protein